MWCSASGQTIGGHLTSTTNLCSWSNLGNTSSTSFENRWMNWMDATYYGRRYQEMMFPSPSPFCFRMSFLWPKYPKFGGMSRWHRGGSNKRPQVQDKNDYTTHDLGMLLTCRFSWWLRPATSQDLSDSCEQQMAVTPKINQKVHVAAVLPCRRSTQLWQEGLYHNCQLTKWVGGLKLI